MIIITIANHKCIDLEYADQTPQLINVQLDIEQFVKSIGQIFTESDQIGFFASVKLVVMRDQVIQLSLPIVPQFVHLLS